MASSPGARSRCRERVFRRDGGKCHWCGRAVRLVPSEPGTPNPPDMATVDHLVLKKDGGTRQMDNIVCACFQCNGIRSDMGVDEFAMVLDIARVRDSVEIVV